MIHLWIMYNFVYIIYTKLDWWDSLNKYIIFDVDGTILDTEQAVLKSLQNVLEEENIYYELKDLKFALGIPGKETLKKIGITDIERVHHKWSKKVLDYSNEVVVFENLKEIIVRLDEMSITTGIVTSKTKQELIDEFDPFELGAYFKEVICADDTKKHKPNPEPLLLCLQKLNASNQEAVYIGDSIYDMQCANSAGVKFALAFWGAKKTDGFEAADYVLRKPEDIFNLITADKNE